MRGGGGGDWWRLKAGEGGGGRGERGRGREWRMGEEVDCGRQEDDMVWSILCLFVGKVRRVFGMCFFATVGVWLVALRMCRVAGTNAES